MKTVTEQRDLERLIGNLRQGIPIVRPVCVPKQSGRLLGFLVACRLGRSGRDA
jgi:hypothetical protein